MLHRFSRFGIFITCLLNCNICVFRKILRHYKAFLSAILNFWKIIIFLFYKFNLRAKRNCGNLFAVLVRSFPQCYAFIHIYNVHNLCRIFCRCQCCKSCIDNLVTQHISVHAVYSYLIKTAMCKCQKAYRFICFCLHKHCRAFIGIFINIRTVI